MSWDNCQFDFEDPGDQYEKTDTGTAFGAMIFYPGMMSDPSWKGRWCLQKDGHLYYRFKKISERDNSTYKIGYEVYTKYGRIGLIKINSEYDKDEGFFSTQAEIVFSRDCTLNEYIKYEYSKANSDPRITKSKLGSCRDDFSSHMIARFLLYKLE